MVTMDKHSIYIAEHISAKESQDMDLVETTTTIRYRIGSRKITVFIWMQWDKCLIVYQSDFLSLSRFPQPDKQDSCIMTQK